MFVTVSQYMQQEYNNNNNLRFGPTKSGNTFVPSWFPPADGRGGGRKSTILQIFNH